MAANLRQRRGVAVDDKDLLRRHLIERLMCDLTLDIDAVCQERGADPRQFDTDLLLLTPLQQDGLIEVTGRQFIMIEAGR